MFFIGYPAVCFTQSINFLPPKKIQSNITESIHCKLIWFVFIVFHLPFSICLLFHCAVCCGGGCNDIQGGRQNLSKYSGNGSITSHCTMPSTDCPDLLNRSFSSARYNNWYSTSGTHCTSISNGCAPMHQRMTPTHRPCPTTNRCCYPNMCPTLTRAPSDGGGHNRLHKSLSFAFQTPMTRNDMYRSYHGTPSGYATTGRIRSR